MKDYDFKIESDVPQEGTHENTIYPFGKMKIGDSFAFPQTIKKKIGAAAHTYGRDYDQKFSIRGLRIWRVL